MTNPISIKKKELFTTGILGVAICFTGFHHLLGGNKISSIIGCVIALLAIISVISSRFVKSEPWDEMCRKNWREASTNTLNILVVVFMLYGIGLSASELAFLHNPGFPIVLAGLATLLRMGLFFKYEGLDNILEDE